MRVRFVGAPHLQVYRGPIPGGPMHVGEVRELAELEAAYVLETFPGLFVVDAPAPVESAAPAAPAPSKRAALKKPPKHAAEE